MGWMGRTTVTGMDQVNKGHDESHTWLPRPQPSRSLCGVRMSRVRLSCLVFAAWEVRLSLRSALWSCSLAQVSCERFEYCETRCASRGASRSRKSRTKTEPWLILPQEAPPQCAMQPWMITASITALATAQPWPYVPATPSPAPSSPTHTILASTNVPASFPGPDSTGKAASRVQLCPAMHRECRAAVAARLNAVSRALASPCAATRHIAGISAVTERCSHPWR